MIDRSDRRRRLTRHLFQVLGFATVAGIALTTACSGNVVVDTSGPSGSGGTTTTTTTFTTYDGYSTGTYSTGDAPPSDTTEVSVGVGGGSSGTGLCTPPLQPGEHAATVCTTSSCSQSYTQDLRTDLAQLLGVCDFDNEDCCNQAALDTIACGPTAGPGGSCCYMTTIYDSAPCPD